VERNDRYGRAVPRYALLVRASANRVFGDAALGLTRAELAVVDRGVLGGVVEHMAPTVIGGVDYLEVATTSPLERNQLAVVSNLSCLHALFALDQDVLRPCEVVAHRVLDEDLTTIQRYVGKTNETFTHLLVNLALAATPGAFPTMVSGARLRALDPACGRGTTLHRAALYGLDAVGIEVDQRSVEAYDTFITTWLKDKRLKHRVERATLRKGRAVPAHRLAITYGRGKDVAEHRVLEVVHDDTLRAADHVRPRSVDLLACDLPYGVQHGATAEGERRERLPAHLLAEALPVWRGLLRPGAGVALGWNRRTLPRPELEGLVQAAGLELLAWVEADAFRHRVDRAIDRDVLVARRPAT
jgi:SAM-dependent methyltransferase